MNPEKEIHREKAEQEALATLGIYALEQNDLEAIMNRAIQQCCIILKLDCVVILKLTGDKKKLELAADAGCARDNIELDNDEKTDYGYALKSAKPVKVVDYKKEKRFDISPLMADQGFVSSAHVIIRGTDDIYGVFGFYTNGKREFSEHDLNFMQIVANIIGRAIEQRKAKRALEKANKRLKKERDRSREYQKEILQNSLAERWKLGGYLHDNLAQVLVSVKILLNEVSGKVADDNVDISTEMEKLKEVIDEGITDIRNLTHDIIPIDIEEKGVHQAFKILMRRTQNLHKVNCILEIDEVLDQVSERKTATNLYHIIQEAVKNAAIHGNAENIKVAVIRQNEKLKIEVKDDGMGFSETDEDEKGRGLKIMKYRMELLGGTFDIKEWSDGEEHGTLIICTIPLEFLRA